MINLFLVNETNQIIMVFPKNRKGKSRGKMIRLLFELGDERGKNLEEIAHDAKIRHAEDGRVRV